MYAIHAQSDRPFAGPQKLVLSSSLLRRLDSRAISNCKIIPRSGKTYSSMNRGIRQGKIKIGGFETIAFLLGTNDIYGAVYCKFGIVGYKKRYCKPIIPKQLVDMDTVKRDYLHLMVTVRSFNSTATIVICHLLPRLGDWARSKEFSFDMNIFLQVWCCQQVAKGRRAIFFPSCKFFQKHGKSSPTYYRWDWVHLSDEGLRRAKQFLQLALSDSNSNQGGVWKHRPAGRQVSGLRTPKVHRNLIVF